MNSIGIKALSRAGRVSGVADGENAGSDIADKLRIEFGDNFEKAEAKHLSTILNKYYAKPNDKKDEAARSLLSVMLKSLSQNNAPIEQKTPKAESADQQAKRAGSTPSPDASERAAEILSSLSRGSSTREQASARSEMPAEKPITKFDASSDDPVSVFPMAAQNMGAIRAALGAARPETAAIAFRQIQRLSEPGSGVHQIAGHLARIAAMPECAAAALLGSRNCLVDGQRTLPSLIGLSDADVSMATAKIVFEGLRQQWGSSVSQWSSKVSACGAIEDVGRTAYNGGVARLEQGVGSVLEYLEGLPSLSDYARELLTYGRQALKKASDFPHWKFTTIFGLPHRTQLGWAKFLPAVSEIMNSLASGLTLDNVSSNPQ